MLELTIYHRIINEGDDKVLHAIQNLRNDMATDFSALTDALAQESNVVQGVITLLNSVESDLKELTVGDQAAVDAMVAKVTANKQALADAIAANTPAATPPATPPAPAPVDAPVDAPAPTTPVDTTTPDAPPTPTDTGTPVADTPAGIPPAVTATPTIPVVEGQDAPVADPLAPANNPTNP